MDINRAMTVHNQAGMSGLAVNLLVFAVKVTAKAFEINLGGGRELTSWLSVATISYPLCGLIAGLVSGAVWFHWSPRPRENSTDERPRNDVP